MYLNCLLHVFGDRPNEVSEWLDYHLQLGFDLVYVYDSGNRPWLDALCERYGEKVKLMPRAETGWAKAKWVVLANGLLEQTQDPGMVRSAIGQ